MSQLSCLQSNETASVFMVEGRHGQQYQRFVVQLGGTKSPSWEEAQLMSEVPDVVEEWKSGPWKAVTQVAVSGAPRKPAEALASPTEEPASWGENASSGEYLSDSLQSPAASVEGLMVTARAVERASTSFNCSYDVEEITSGWAQHQDSVSEEPYDLAYPPGTIHAVGGTAIPKLAATWPLTEVPPRSVSPPRSVLSLPVSPSTSSFEEPFAFIPEPVRTAPAHSDPSTPLQFSVSAGSLPSFEVSLTPTPQCELRGQYTKLLQPQPPSANNGRLRAPPENPVAPPPPQSLADAAPAEAPATPRSEKEELVTNLFRAFAYCRIRRPKRGSAGGTGGAAAESCPTDTVIINVPLKANGEPLITERDVEKVVNDFIQVTAHEEAERERDEMPPPPNAVTACNGAVEVSFADARGVTLPPPSNWRESVPVEPLPPPPRPPRKPAVADVVNTATRSPQPANDTAETASLTVVKRPPPLLHPRRGVAHAEPPPSNASPSAAPTTKESSDDNSSSCCSDADNSSVDSESEVPRCGRSRRHRKPRASKKSDSNPYPNRYWSSMRTARRTTVIVTFSKNLEERDKTKPPQPQRAATASLVPRPAPPSVPPTAPAPPRSSLLLFDDGMTRPRSPRSPPCETVTVVRVPEHIQRMQKERPRPPARLPSLPEAPACVPAAAADTARANQSPSTAPALRPDTPAALAADAVWPYRMENSPSSSSEGSKDLRPGRPNLREQKITEVQQYEQPLGWRRRAIFYKDDPTRKRKK